MSSQNHYFKTQPGAPLPLGPTNTRQGVNFALFSRHAESVVLVLERTAGNAPPGQWVEIKLDPCRNRTGDIWHIEVKADAEPLRYGYRVNGTPRPEAGIIFTPEAILLDPYCRRFEPRPWGSPAYFGSRPLCLTGPEQPFDWQGDRPLRLPAKDLIIYELHVRGFTQHANSGVSAPGTFSGLIEKIPYLRELGVTAVELLPVTEWDENDNIFHHPETGEKQRNFWGYHPLSFFALKSGFARNPDEHINEFKTMVRTLHAAGIEVILDMVFNHTGETEYGGVTSWLRGIDNASYYLIDAQNGSYHNFTGCGNTVHCNHPVVRALILESLHYWVREMHVDGFRFDLASIFHRGEGGAVLDPAPLVELIAEDPLLRDTRIIAEPWDAAGLYQVGSFSTNPRWQEWNGRYRDDVRRFLAGLPNTVHTLATRIAGNSDLYRNNGRGPLNSINFITSHDGFTLYDLVSYHDKYNHANGENNRDGENHNLSWNSGHEGSPCPPEIEKLRARRIRSFAALLLFSQGIPMLTAGDEYGKTQHGNNNCWCQDNELSWLDWSLADKNKDLLRFFKKCIALRKQYRHFRRTDFFRPDDTHDDHDSEISWQAEFPGTCDWSTSCRCLGFLLHGAAGGEGDGCDFFIAVNGDPEATSCFTLPEPASGLNHSTWRHIVDTSRQSPQDFVAASRAKILKPGDSIDVLGMGLIVVQSHPDKSDKAAAKPGG